MNRITRTENALKLNHTTDFIWIFVNGKLSVSIDRKDYWKMLIDADKSLQKKVSAIDRVRKTH